MAISTTGNQPARGNFRAGVLALALAAGVCAMAVGTAQAQGDNRGRQQHQEMRHDQGRHEGWQHRPRRHVVVQPTYGYAYPRTVYAPPPVIYYPPPPSPGLSLIFPLNIR